MNLCVENLGGDINVSCAGGDVIGIGSLIIDLRSLLSLFSSDPLPDLNRSVRLEKNLRLDDDEGAAGGVGLEAWRSMVWNGRGPSSTVLPMDEYNDELSESRIDGVATVVARGPSIMESGSLSSVAFAAVVDLGAGTGMTEEVEAFAEATVATAASDECDNNVLYIGAMVENVPVLNSH